MPLACGRTVAAAGVVTLALAGCPQPPSGETDDPADDTDRPDDSAPPPDDTGEPPDDTGPDDTGPDDTGGPGDTGDPDATRTCLETEEDPYGRYVRTLIFDAHDRLVEERIDGDGDDRPDLVARWQPTYDTAGRPVEVVFTVELSDGTRLDGVERYEDGLIVERRMDGTLFAAPWFETWDWDGADRIVFYAADTGETYEERVWTWEDGRLVAYEAPGERWVWDWDDDRLVASETPELRVAWIEHGPHGRPLRGVGADAETGATLIETWTYDDGARATDSLRVWDNRRALRMRFEWDDDDLVATVRDDGDDGAPDDIRTWTRDDRDRLIAASFLGSREATVTWAWSDDQMLAFDAEDMDGLATRAHWSGDCPPVAWGWTLTPFQPPDDVGPDIPPTFDVPGPLLRY